MIPEKHMGDKKVRDPKSEKAERPTKRATGPSGNNPSGAPSGGGSRQGNIGHEGSQASDNAHR